MTYNTNHLKNTKILITGGTGTFGKAFTYKLLSSEPSVNITIFSRDEYKQYQFKNELKSHFPNNNVKFVLGDIRDSQKVSSVTKDIQYIIHAAAQKQVPSCEENIDEAIKTNIIGALNIYNAAIQNKVKKVISLSTDKAVEPINLYGATKMISDKVLLQKGGDTIFSVVRYGNVANSRGSVIPLFKDITFSRKNVYPVTDCRMTRFWIDVNKATEIALTALVNAKSGEIYVAKLPSFRITDLVYAFNSNANIEEIGIREGEKIHEVLISSNDALKTCETEDLYIIYPSVEAANKSINKRVKPDFYYASNNNPDFLSVNDIHELLIENEILY